MAENTVISTINSLVTLLVDETKLLSSIHKEITSVKSELESIQAFLKDADSRAEQGDEIAKTWVKQVRGLCHEIEDVIDIYLLQHRGEQGHYCFIDFLRKAACSIFKLKQEHEMASQIQNVKFTIREVKERADRYKSDSLAQCSRGRDSTWYDPRVVSLFIEEHEIVGIESPRKELIDLLLATVPKRTVISIVGMGGMGKTTLAKKVYDRVMRHFDCYAWLPVSQSYDTTDLLKTMIKQFYQSRKQLVPKEIHEGDPYILLNVLRAYLLRKRYIIVFDDLWKTDFWGFFRNALPNNDRGSRAIITTRSDKVAATCNETSLDYVHKLRPLQPQEAWVLFCKKAFQTDFGGHCPQALVNVSKDITRRCKGLPLAIVAIGGLLSTKDKVASEWQRFYHSLGSEFESNPDLTSIKEIILLSYHGLPSHLKSCFLYFGIMPEAYSISRGRLIRLWLAEGFVREQKGKTLEEVAEGYLIDLIQRSLVQLTSRKFDGRVETCRIHDLVREIILSKSKEISFCQVLSEDEENSIVDQQTRRLSIHNCTHNKVLESKGNATTLRSIFLFGEMQIPEDSSLSHISFANFKCLKMLDLQDASMDHLPKEVGNLFHLVYLSIRNTKVRKIPKSLGRMQNLQTLDLKGCLVRKLPNKISMLLKLRHLLASSYNLEIEYSLDTVQGVKVHHGGIGCLKELQKLWYVEANCHDANLMIKELQNLKQLRKLGLTKLTRENMKALCATIERLKHLEVLYLWAMGQDEIMDIQHISSPPQSLQRLTLGGCLQKLPVWIQKLQNLSRLSLCCSGLVSNHPLEPLQELPNLLVIDLYQAYEGTNLSFPPGAFPKLKFLYLRALKRLNWVVIEDGAMPCIEELHIGPSPQLKAVPPSIQHLKKLTTLQFNDMPEEFLERMQPGGEDYSVVGHIPFILLGFKDTGVYHKMYTLQQYINGDVLQVQIESPKTYKRKATRGMRPWISCCSDMDDY